MKKQLLNKIKIHQEYLLLKKKNFVKSVKENKLFDFFADNIRDKSTLRFWSAL